MYVDTQECHTQIKCTGNINTLIMLDSPENLDMMEKNLMVSQQFQAEEEDAQGEW
jgi:hypothetical protein